MKDFLKTIAASFIALVLFVGVAGAISVISIIGMAATAGLSQKSSVEDGSVLVLDMDATISEQTREASPMAMLQGGDTHTVGLSDMLRAIKNAKENDKVKGIFLSGGELISDISQKQELRDALVDFKKSKKWIIAYGENYGIGSYYVASVADKIYTNPSGMIEWDGLGSSMPFLKNLLDKLGVKAMAFKCGKFKSATENFTEDKMSEPSRQQAQRYISVWWNTMCKAVSESRHISIDSLNSYADNAMSMQDAKVLVKTKMVDGLLYGDEVKNVIKKQLKLDKDEDIPQVFVSDLQDEKEKGDKVAVYYASGDIVDVAPRQGMFSNAELIVGDDFCKDMADIADDDDIKAVVLRINSGGGSAYASEQMWHAIEQLKKEKPVVVSMSGAAASGGYYISSGANYIYAEPTTITGSIGIFGLLGDGSKLFNKYGITFDAVQTNRNSAMGGIAVPTPLFAMFSTSLTPEQAAKIQANVDHGYNLFKTRVAKGRKLSMAAVEERAQGHVFTGTDALKLKLVDGLGGLDKAVAKAAQLAKLKEYHAVGYPAEKSFFEKMMEKETYSGDKYLESKIRAEYNNKLRESLGALYEPLMMLQNIGCYGRVQARMPYMMTQMD